jgi:hypothetical protein
VNGGGGPSLSPVDIGTAAQMGIQGSIKALNQSDAPGWSGFANGINQFNQNYNPVYMGLDAARNYLNQPSGSGASMDSNGPVNPDMSSFLAP